MDVQLLLALVERLQSCTFSLLFCLLPWRLKYDDAARVHAFVQRLYRIAIVPQTPLSLNINASLVRNNNLNNVNHTTMNSNLSSDLSRLHAV